MNTRQRVTTGVLALSLIGASALGCAASGQTAPGIDAPAASSAESGPEVEPIYEAFAGIGYDYDPFANPDALAEASSYVVEGTVSTFSPGRRLVITGTDEPTAESVVITLTDPAVLKGDQPRETFYVELSAPAPEDPDTYNKIMPPGTRLLVYLRDAWDGSNPADESLEDPDAGRPVGEPLYTLTNPQSFIVQAQDNQLVWPLLAETRQGTLEEAAPGGEELAK